MNFLSPILKFSFFNLIFSIAASGMPNVLILLTDDQGTLDVNCYGAKDLKTPHMDSLAETGIRFTQAYAHTVCCPSRAALLTGRHPNRGGVQSWLQGDRNGSDAHLGNMDPSEITLAEVLKEAGYETVLFGKWHLGAKVGHGPLDQGFDQHFGHLSGFIDNYTHYFLHGQGYHDLYDDNEEIFRRNEYFPVMIVDEAVEYIGEDREAPFFATVAFNLPHYPEQPLQELKQAYPDLEMPRQSYARVVETVDRQIGRILQKLDETDQREDTIIIFSSDNGHSEENNRGITVGYHNSGYPIGHYYLAHGGGGYTGKWIGHKATFLEGGVRVPMIISYPKELPQGIARDQAITIMDWMPTLLDLIDLPAPRNRLDGHSLLTIIKNANAPTPHPVLHFDWREDWAVREGDWKLIAKKNRQSGEMVYSLHNLADAKPEVADYASEKPELVAHFKTLHESWAKEVKSK
ncbi:MAG: sulfatase [Verrucomicrobia bacterium TMED71]|nr:MAG: sulfatase [Verrucomicrobia bacterium TMED71]